MSPWSLDSLRWLERGRKVRLRGADLVLIAACSLAALLLLGPARWAPGALKSALAFGLFALGLLGLRTVQATWPRFRPVKWVADFWLLPVAGLGHDLLNPLVDALNPVLRDAQLAQLEARLFGVQVSVHVSNAVPPWLHDVLMLCYYGHFVWAVALGVVLYLQRRTTAFDELILGLSLFFTLNYAGYALVPAIGPRFFLLDAFPGPLTGPLLTPLLDSLMRLPAFTRDCFPSGHTGTTLLLFFYAWRFARRFFWVMLLPGLGLIVATLSGRFHYATDLVVVLPVVVLVAGLSVALSRVGSRRRSFATERSVAMNAIVRP
ncbi:phosphatase PAP2 family protein [Hyalangium rubrum]|uniref:Phosphatase PAP2 family protein n=1 Tax=Hyalangium rubrum TaxID=3103134 RepID=A0ABU5HL86_9BACT|nr:phosphatase PAP2 family protein [Hyalangium sp. s54d21]MDY7232855.1 phosphatase PAP2 family protein [Hyalangium sp. s54d21]